MNEIQHLDPIWAGQVNFGNYVGYRIGSEVDVQITFG